MRICIGAAAAAVSMLLAFGVPVNDAALVTARQSLCGPNTLCPNDPPPSAHAATTDGTSFRRNPPLRRRDGEQVPLAGHTLELVCAALLELEPRPDHEVAQRAGHQHIVRPCQRAHPRTDVHGDPADVINAPAA